MIFFMRHIMGVYRAHLLCYEALDSRILSVAKDVSF